MVTSYGPGWMVLELRGLEGKPGGTSGRTRLGNWYASYYLTPVYGNPALVSTTPAGPREAGARARKVCAFNFTKVS